MGAGPDACEISHAEVSEVEVWGGKAVRREVDVFFGTPESQSMRLLIYTPKNENPAAAFLTLNFQGNHSVDADPSISLNKNWMRSKKRNNENNRATEKSRGVAASRWPIETIIDRGYALVTIYYGDIDPDTDDGFQNGIHGTLQDQTKDIPDGEKWGSIAGWAYGLSRALDYLEVDQRIDAERVAVFGHSRLGKTALWAGATDERFRLVISNNSGCGGAALSRRGIGETVGRINTSFPHWFNDNFTKYNQNENACPVDQHELISLIAPRAVYVASATEDKWADPKGSSCQRWRLIPFIACWEPTGSALMHQTCSSPHPNNRLQEATIGYHLRTGKHDVTDFDWEQYLDFADLHLR